MPGKVRKAKLRISNFLQEGKPIGFMAACDVNHYKTIQLAESINKSQPAVNVFIDQKTKGGEASITLDLRSLQYIDAQIRYFLKHHSLKEVFPKQFKFKKL